MDKIVDYVVATAVATDMLENEINKLLQEGFQPLGSLSAVYASDDERVYLYQAMVKPSEFQIKTLPNGRF